MDACGRRGLRRYTPRRPSKRPSAPATRLAANAGLPSHFACRLDGSRHVPTSRFAAADRQRPPTMPSACSLATFRQVVGLAVVASAIAGAWRLFDDTLGNLAAGNFDPADASFQDVVPVLVGGLVGLYFHLAITARMAAFASNRPIAIAEALRRALRRLSGAARVRACIHHPVQRAFPAWRGPDRRLRAWRHRRSAGVGAGHSS